MSKNGKVVIGLFALLLLSGVVGLTIRLWDNANGDVKTPNIFSVREHDCFQVPDAQKIDEVTELTCDQPHNAEMFGRVLLPEAKYPGETALKRTASDECPTAAGPRRPPEGVRVDWVYPTEPAWGNGARWIVCFYSAKGDPLTRPITSASTAVEAPSTPEQQRYLDAAGLVTSGLSRFFAVEAEWTTRSDLAKGVKSDVELELKMLTDSAWSAEVQPSMDALVTQLRLELQDWERAAHAESRQQLEDALAAQKTHDSAGHAAKVREALRLPGS